MRSPWFSLVMVLFATAASIPTALGEERTALDGVIAVTAPDAADFQRVDDPPEPFIALWLSNDEMLRLGVIKIAVPSHVGKLIRSSTEEGLAEEVNGVISASSSVVKNGHEIWIMTAKGSAQGIPLQITQAITQYNGSVYKVVAAAVGDDITDDTTMTTLNAFVNSLEITSPKPDSESAPIANRDQRSSDELDRHDLSKRIGGISALLLIGLIVWLVARRGKPKP